MNIIIIYLLLLITLLIFFLLTRVYKKEFTAGLVSKEHPLKFLYGTAFFLLDIFSSLRKKLFPNHSVHNTKLKSKLDKLYSGKDTRKIEYLLQAKRISYSLLILAGFIFIGFCYSCNALNSSKRVTSLQRTDEESSYSFEVSIEDKETHIVDITVSPKEYDFKESLNIFEEYREQIVSELLGENKGIDAIQYPLHFISEIGEKGLTIRWEIENEELIDAFGQIYPENIELCGAATSVTACLSLGEYTASLTIPLVLVP